MSHHITPAQRWQPLIWTPILGLLLALVVCWPAVAVPGQPLEFHLRFDPTLRREPFTGRVYVMLLRKDQQELPGGPRWVDPEPFFALDVKDWQPGQVVRLTRTALGCPLPLAQLPRDTYTIHAVLDLNRGERSFATAPGNLHNKALRRALDPATSGPVELVLNQVYQPRKFPESERLKLVEIESKLLSQFHRHPVLMRAGVLLPKSYGKEPGQRYPVIYEIPGFGGNHFHAQRALARNATELAGLEMIHVTLDPGCRWGHHVFADSDNNGPVGQALCQELIPHIERTYRGIGAPTARFVTGHSSGGWSSLWLQVTYPDFFGGCWSTAPDPVDFRDFQRVNIYPPGTNLFTDPAGKSRPLGRRGGKVILHYQPFSDMEEVMGHGGQLGSFEGVFSPRGTDGRPRQLWDRKTGLIDPEVARSWQRYDIRLQVERNWERLGPRLAKKIHVYMGKEDNYYLEGATILLREALARLGSDAVIEIFPGRDHGTLIDQQLRQRMNRAMADQFRRLHRE